MDNSNFMRFNRLYKPKSREEVRKELNEALAQVHDQRNIGLLVKVMAGLSMIPCSLVAMQGHTFLNGANYQSLGYTMFLLGLGLTIFSGLVILMGVSFQINMNHEVNKLQDKLSETHRSLNVRELA